MQTPDQKTIAHLADKLVTADHDRFRAIMACPGQTRATLFAVFNINLEIAQAPWASQEPMISEMRLQWWIDALDAVGKQTHAHPALDLLAPRLSHQNIQDLQTLITARRWDIYSDPFDKQTELNTYLCQTGGLLYKVAANLLGAQNTDVAENFGIAIATANYLMALPALERAGKRPLYDGSAAAIQALANWALGHLPTKPLDPQTRFACLSGYRAKTILTRASHSPNLVAQGAITINPFQDRLLLLKARYF